MPELPDLEVTKEYLAAHVVGQTIAGVDHVGAIVVRNLQGGAAASALIGRAIASVDRRGKFLLLGLDNRAWLAINFMLSGRLMHCPPQTRLAARTFLVLHLSGGRDLRYTDQAQMGKVYITAELEKIPTFAGQGPDALDPTLTLGAFGQRLKRHPGEIKGILTNAEFVAGIGNAYADEILFAAGLYPFRKRPSLTADETERLYAAMRSLLPQAIETLRSRVGDNIHEEIRDFLRVHGKGGQPCPRCGAPISQVSANQRITNFCRACQPGALTQRGQHKPVR